MPLGWSESPKRFCSFGPEFCQSLNQTNFINTAWWLWNCHRTWNQEEQNLAVGIYRFERGRREVSSSPLIPKFQLPACPFLCWTPQDIPRSSLAGLLSAATHPRPQVFHRRCQRAGNGEDAGGSHGLSRLTPFLFSLCVHNQTQEIHFAPGTLICEVRWAKSLGRREYGGCRGKCAWVHYSCCIIR